MKILLVHNYYQYRGGEDTYFESLIRLLKRKGHYILTYVKQNSNISSLSDKVKTGIGLFFNKTVYQELTNLMRQEKPDIVQFQNIYPLISPSAYKACYDLKIPIIQRISNYRFLCPKATLFRNNNICNLCINKRLKYPAVQYGCYHGSNFSSLVFTTSFFYHQVYNTFRYVDAYIFPTDFSMRIHLEASQIPKNSCTVIPTFTDIRNGANIQTAANRKHFLYFGQLNNEKGIMPMLDSFSRLIPNINLVIIGDGPIKNQVVKRAKQLDVQILGWQPRNELSRYIKQAIATIIPSLWYDVLPNALLESIAFGTPVIVPYDKSFSQIVAKNNMGILYNASEPGSLVTTVSQLASSVDSPYYKEITRNARIAANTLFSPDSHYQSLIKLYRRYV